MFPKLLKMAFAQLRQELLIIQVPRYGKVSTTTISAIFGPLAALFIKCAAYFPLSEQKTFRHFFNQSSKEITKISHQLIQNN